MSRRPIVALAAIISIITGLVLGWAGMAYPQTTYKLAGAEIPGNFFQVCGLALVLAPVLGALMLWRKNHK